MIQITPNTMLEFVGGPLDGRRELWEAEGRGMRTVYHDASGEHVYTYVIKKAGPLFVVHDDGQRFIVDEVIAEYRGLTK